MIRKGKFHKCRCSVVAEPSRAAPVRPVENATSEGGWLLTCRSLADSASILHKVLKQTGSLRSQLFRFLSSSSLCSLDPPFHIVISFQANIKMRLVIQNDANLVTEWAARYVMKRIRDFQPGPDRYFVLGLPTGKHMVHYI